MTDGYNDDNDDDDDDDDDDIDDDYDDDDDDDYDDDHDDIGEHYNNDDLAPSGNDSNAFVYHTSIDHLQQLIPSSPHLNHNLNPTP